MADDNKVLKAINSLREENKHYSTLSVLQGENQEEFLADISLSMKELLDQMSMSRLDAEEARREESQQKSPEPPEKKGASKDDKVDFELKGILQIVAGIGAAVTGFAVGLVQGFKNIFALASAKFVSGLKNIFAPVGRLVDALSDVFGKRGTGQFLKGDTYKTLGRLTKGFRSFADTIKRIEILFAYSTQGVGSIATTVKSYAGMIANTVKEITKLGFDKATTKISSAVKSFFTSILNIQRSVVKFMTFDELKNFKGLITKITDPFRNFINGIRGVGESSSRIGKILGSFFSAFKVIGRYVAFPLTVIMGIIDGFKGLQAGMDRQVGFFEKMVGGAIGAITGVLKGLIAMPLDLLKDGISWIAGKLGFTEFEKMLDSFSFADMFQMVGDKIADGFVKFFHGLTYWFTDIKDRLMKPFEDGFSFGAVLDLITSLPGTIVGGIMDFAKNGLSALLSIFGQEDASKALDSFKFTDLIDNIISRIGFFFSDMFGSISSSFMNIFNGDGPMLERIFNFAKNLVTSIFTWPYDLLKNIASGLLGFFGQDDAAQALDSFSFKDTFGAIIDWVVALPGKIVDGLMAIFSGEVSIGDLISDAMTGAMSMAEQFNEWIKGLVRPTLQGIATGDGVFASLQKKALEAVGVFDWAGVNADTGEITAPKVSAPETTTRTDNGSRVAEMSRENEQAKSSATNVVVSAPVQTNQNVTNNNTAAVIDQNQPTVDYNDRSFGNNLTWQGGKGLV